VNTPAYNAEALQAQMTTGLWSLAMYNTATDALLGILWLMIVFAFLSTVAVAFIRRSKIRWLLPERQENPWFLVKVKCTYSGSPEIAIRVRVVTLSRAGTAEGAAADGYFALEVDAFAAFGTDDAGAFESRQVFRMNLHLHPFG